jgi:hypothetical protein
VEPFAGRQSVLKLSLENALTGPSNLMLEIAFASSWIPAPGFLGTLWFVTLGIDTGDPFAMAMTSNRVKSRPTTDPIGVGRLVPTGLTGDGLKIFTGQTGDSVSVQFRFNRITKGPDTVVSINLPQGYWCIPQETGWTVGSTPNACKYQLGDGEIWNANSWQSVSIKVSNPTTRLLRSDGNNVWSIEVSDGGKIPAFTNNRAVVTFLKYGAIQPEKFNGPQYLSIYLEISYLMSPGSGLVIVAPDGVSLDRSTSCLQLFESTKLFNFISGDISCETDPYLTGQNSVVIRNRRIIDPGSVLGFGLKISGTSTISGGWSIFVIDSNGNPVEASLDLPFGSWIVYPTSLTMSGVTPSSLVPYAMSGSSTDFVISGIQSPLVTGKVSLAIQLPVGFQFDLQSVKNVPFQYDSVLTVTSNKIQFENATLTGNFDLSLPVTVPEFTDEFSAYRTYIEVKRGSAPVAGTVLPTPPVQAVQLHAVQYTSTVVGTPNSIIFRFVTVSALAAGDAIEVRSTSSDISASVLAVLEQFSGDTSKISVSGIESSPFKVRFGVTGSIPAGSYRLQLRVVNPAASSPSCSWRITTAPKDWDSQPVLGPPIQQKLFPAEIVADSQGRDDRLGRSNRIVFRLGTGESSTIIIEGPPGFVFNENCAADVDGVQVVTCRGSVVDRPSVRSRISIVLSGTPGSPVQVGIKVRNPVARGESGLDFWTVNFGDKSSELIPNFPLRDFSDFTVSLTSNVAGISVPARFVFVPKQSLPVTNTGPLKLRTDTYGTQFGALNTTLNSGIFLKLPTGYTWDVNKTTAELRNIDSNFTFTKLVYNLSSPGELYIVFVGSQTLVSGNRYAFVRNVIPALSNGVFTITSLSPQNLVPMDESSFNAPSLLTPLSSFEVSNLDANYDPGAVVNARFNVTGLPATQSVVIKAPAGFCCDFTRSVPYGETSLVWEQTVTNANVMNIDGTRNVWTVTAGTQSRAADSWRVVSPLASTPSLSILGNQGASSSSVIVLRLKPTNQANFVHLTLPQPLGFNFSSATVANPDYQLFQPTTSISCWHCVSVAGLEIEPGREFELVIRNVVLGKVGGDIVMSVRTYFVPSTFVNPLTSPLMFRDKALLVTGPFMSGKLTVESSKVILDDSTENIPDFITEVLNPRTLTRAILQMDLSFTLSPALLRSATGLLNQPVDIKWIIESGGFSFQTDSPVRYFPSIGRIVSTGSSSDALEIHLTAYMSEIKALTSSGLRVEVPVTPLVGGTTSLCRIEMYVNGTLLNTNDGTSSVPSDSSTIPVNAIPASAVKLTVGTDFVAPYSNIPVSVLVKPSLLPPTATGIKIFTPPAFHFFSVSVSGQAVITASTTTAVTLRLSLQDDFTVNFKVRTPMMLSQSQAAWVAIMYSASGMLGWSEMEAVPVNPMPQVNFVHGGTSGAFKSNLVVDFLVRKDSTISSIEIFPPVGMVVSCDPSISLGFINCTAPSNNEAGLTLNRTGSLSPGRYTVPLLVDLPLSTPKLNSFDLYARNAIGDNSDGVFAVDGRSIIDSTILSVVDPRVAVNSTIAGRVALVNVTFEMTSSTTSVDAVHFRFPPGYTHRITDPFAEVKCVNRKFPRKSAMDWLYTNSTDSITFLVDDTQTNIIDRNTGRVISLNKIPGGQRYAFTFPIVLPESTPAFGNYWVLSFCSSRYSLSSCTNVTASNAISQFPIPGIKLTVKP